MRFKEMISLLEKSTSYDEQSLEELKTILEEYPYFQLAHLLYALNLRELKDSRFRAELRNTAIYLPDRKQLFFQLESEFFSSERVRQSKTEPDETSSFELIDSFLQENKSGEIEGVSSVRIRETVLDKKERMVASTDYISYLLLEESDEDTTLFPPMRYEDQINRFIQEDEKNRIRFELKDTPDTNDRESAIPIDETPMEDRFFSETLAKIYIKQRKYDKALKIIRELNLLYPEKSRYFADQIRFLEKLIINTNKIK